MKKNKIDVVNGFGRIAAPGRVSVAGADGSETAYSAQQHPDRHGLGAQVASGIEIDHKAVLSSDSILEVTEVPKSLLVIGSGAVGVEFASVFARFGSKTIVVEILPRVVPIEDEEVSRELAASFKRQGIAVYVDTRIERVNRAGGRSRGARPLRRGEDRELQGREDPDGRRAKAPLRGIGLEGAGVATDRGYILVDAMMRTNVPGIYAIGDVVPTAQLAHVASAEGVVAVEHMAGEEPAAHQLRPGSRLHLLRARDRLDRARPRRRRASAATTWPSGSSRSPPTARRGS